jgi:hypothetical protein
MSTEMSAPRSRRAILAAAAGAAAATVASAFARTAPVRAGIDGDVVLGQVNTPIDTTAIVYGDVLDHFTVLRLAAGDGATALEAFGKIRFPTRSGRVAVPAGRSYVDINLSLGGDSPWTMLEGTPLCFANLMSYRPGVFVTTVRPNYPSRGRIRIYLNKAVTASAYVSWLVLN